MSTAVTEDSTPLSPAAILNVAGYKFVSLSELPALRKQLLEAALELGLRGTILLSPEGINLFMAGPEVGLRSFLSKLRQHPPFKDFEVKESWSEEIPFRRMLVRLKREIIAFGVESVVPEQRTSPKLSAKDLRAWMDEGRPLHLLDVRNQYEVDLGTFANAQHLKIDHFREFPDAIRQLPDEAKQEPVVMFCTGGIRCEKAGPLMEQAGFQKIYQLDGGILKYFEECGAAHYDGACFVFDGRVALDPDLQPTGNLLCFACQAVLDADDVQSEKFSFGQYCPHCFESECQKESERIEQRQFEVQQLAKQQPGSQPYVNQRRIYVSRRLAGLPLIDFLCRYHPPTTRENWQSWIADRSITYKGQSTSEKQIVLEGACFEQAMPGTVEPEINPLIRLLHEDELLVVVDKPAPLPMHPSGRYNRNTLTSIMEPLYTKQKLRAAHRLDANTSGVVLLCRTYQAAQLLQPQFAAGEVEKVYLARVLGHPEWDHQRCDTPIGIGNSGPQIRMPCEEGQPAVTEFRCVDRFSDGTSLIEASPKTGRTNQIRVHLWSLGLAIQGDPLYLDASNLGEPITLAHHAPPMCLHARKITFRHPQTKRRMTFEAPLPTWTTP